ncbi:flagellar motor switch protein FliM [Microbacterium sp. 77mftsu3.1]|uniref:flagellar motor switch protein FliM n=1 Tax=Microbacterium sp. 77mftsu3.1 TaxID=1761802 RepID=UPI000373D41F|nr:flagellar motor switch protein FliM [Microbacterium sp. 77mftsu3.1]SDH36226.1 flagellar motor switch protein FliM [Microbacterium sp. 77mftsu3.1]
MKKKTRTVEPAAEAEAATPEPELYDFGRPASLSREHSRALSGAFDAFARTWAMQLATKIRLRAQVSLAKVGLETYDEYVASVPAQTTLVVSGLPDSEERGIVEFPLPTALSWISKMIGGDGSKGDDRPLTTVEQALLRGLMDETLANLRTSLGGLLPEDFTVRALQYNAAFAQVAGAHDLMVVARFDLKLADTIEHATIALPAVSLLERLSHTASTPDPDSDPAHLIEHIANVLVEVSLRMSEQTISPDKIAHLAVGDVIPLAHRTNRPLDLTVGGHPFATASLGQSGKRLACTVTSPESPTSLSEESK